MHINAVAISMYIRCDVWTDVYIFQSTSHQIGDIVLNSFRYTLFMKRSQNSLYLYVNYILGMNCSYFPYAIDWANNIYSNTHNVKQPQFSITLCWCCDLSVTCDVNNEVINQCNVISCALQTPEMTVQY